MHFVNTLKTLVFMGILTALIVVVGGVFGGKTGMMVAFGFACVMNIGSYWFSDKIALAAHQAQPIEREQAPVLYEIVERLATRANIPVPPIYLIPTDSPNAFATGRDPEHLCSCSNSWNSQDAFRRRVGGRACSRAWSREKSRRTSHYHCSSFEPAW